ncbi:globin domain-containing protein [Luteolibacter arcticus]|uniref:Globin domain-containing protein n=1 Tax=Luteolibacter arcticus TaxID=1581411 RepID=A0ABT3GPE7_9BACT|nr:globin domain-containing protein [Luteolibacter arcticus]MCW1925394.1 globin domain-containing protein [Luteolibacter arcticus]
MLDLEQKLLLRKTFAVVERQSHVSALMFYQRLFELDPMLRPLFKSDIEPQAVKLMDMLAALLDMLEKPDELNEIMEEMGIRHLGYGVKDEHYATVGVALLGMLSSVLGKEFDATTRQAWAALYQLIAEAMLRGAAGATK